MFFFVSIVYHAVVHMGTFERKSSYTLSLHSSHWTGSTTQQPLHLKCSEHECRFVSEVEVIVWSLFHTYTKLIEVHGVSRGPQTDSCTFLTCNTPSGLILCEVCEP